MNSMAWRRTEARFNNKSSKKGDAPYEGIVVSDVEAENRENSAILLRNTVTQDINAFGVSTQNSYLCIKPKKCIFLEIYYLKHNYLLHNLRWQDNYR
jgi:hypothetical protein